MSKTILITGCSSGIGHACALGLQARGWRVFATARRAEDLARLAADGLEVIPLELDDSASIAAAVAQLLAATGGRLDALFNNAGYGQPGAVEDLPRAAMRQQFESNVFGPLELTNLLLPVMRAQGHGRIVFNSSVLGYAAMRMRGAYNASKFAIEGVADTLRLELRGSGIEVALIEPGPITSRFRANSAVHLQCWIVPGNSVHQASYPALQERLLHEGAVAPFTLPAAAVLPKLIHALEARQPRARYPITVLAHVLAWLKRLLPTRTLDGLLARAGRAEGPRG